MIGNWIRQTTTSTVSPYTLAEVAGYPALYKQFAVNEYFYCTVVDDATGVPYQAAIGHLTANTTLVLDKILATYSSGTYSDNDPTEMTLPAGTKRVICSLEQGAIKLCAPDINPITNYKIMYPTGQVVGQSAAAVAMLLDYVVYIPTMIQTPRTIDAIMFRVSLAGSAGSVSKVGIYSSTLDAKPLNRIEQSAAISTTVTGPLTGTLTKRRYKPGLYFLAYTCNVSNPTVNTPQPYAAEPIFGGDSNMLAGNGCYYEATTANILPATAAVTLGLRTIDSTPLLAMRVT